MGKQIVLADSYLDSYENLDTKSKKITRNKISNFAEENKTNGFQIHSLNKINCDSSFKSARINRDLRLIFSQQSNKYIFLYVDHHDEAYSWAEGKYFNKSSFGALYIKDDTIELEERKKELDRKTFLNIYRNAPGILKEKNISFKDLKKLDIDDEVAEYLLEIKDIDTFLDFIDIIPEETAEGLLSVITGGKTIDEVYKELSDENVNEDSTIEEALNHKNSKRRFYFVNNQEELNHILKEDIEKWKLFLHPNQEEIVKKNFNGPALIEGGPGTGKTVVGIHRAVYLANNIYEDPENKILISTFSKKLANYIKDKLKKLIKQKNVANNILVKGIDSEIYRLINYYNLTNKEINIDKLDQIFKEVYKNHDLKYDLDFYKTEYNEVIQRYFIRDLNEYLKIDRLGRSRGIGKKERKIIWNYFEKILKLKEKNNLIDFEDRAWILYKALLNDEISPIYDSIIVDEAQDLSPIKLKVIENLVKNQPNNLIILSDQNQRIYKLDSWKQDVGLNIVGRTYYLSLNYRTTKQIREYADNQFIENELSNSEYLKNYKSVYVGPEPIIKEFDSQRNQYHYIIKKIKNYISNGINPWEIGIISPIDRKEIAGILKFNEINFSYLEGKTYPKSGTGVSITSLHGSKGLEFKIVFLANYAQIDKKLISSISDKWYNTRRKLQSECLRYVACTRARDELIVTYID